MCLGSPDAAEEAARQVCRGPVELEEEEEDEQA